MTKEKKYPVLSKLKGRITEKGESYRSVSRKTGIFITSLNNKVNDTHYRVSNHTVEASNRGLSKRIHRALD